MNVRPYFRVGPRAGCIVTLLALLVLLLARSAWGQVTAVAELRHGTAELKVGNPTPGPLHVSIAVFRDATKASGAVTLGDSVKALITPSSFVLEPAAIQTVRIRIREAVRPGELLRLVTLLDPRSPEAGQSIQLRVAVRLITKLQAVGP
jgi:hypothetical protein